MVFFLKLEAMLEEIKELPFSPLGWALAIIGTFLLGIAKGGIKGLGIIITTIMALVFGSKASTGILMPLLMAGDLFAVIYYNRHAAWKYLWKLFPFMLVGILIGVWYGKDLPEDVFKRGMAILILVSVVLMWISERTKSYKIPDNRFVAGIMGTLSGFSTMVGNLAGPFSELYFLAVRVPKEVFIGTAAWLFFLTNIVKLPFHIWSWKTIHHESLLIDVLLLPSLLIGLFAGVYLVKKIRQDQFRLIIM